jgi:hydrogenase nickel incorporation protein HypA/HybF
MFWFNRPMHELAVTESILEICLRHAEKAEAKRIVSINLVIGQVSSILDDSVQFYWDMISEGTIAKGARLYFERIPAEMKCSDCGEIFSPDDETFLCPRCHSQRVRIIKGDEFRVDSIDVE